MNRYTFTGGEFKGRVCYWLRAGEYGVHIDWEDGEPGFIPYKEWERYSQLLDRTR